MFACLSGQGIEALKDAIKELVWAGEIKAEMLQVMINSRHQDALNRARAAAQRTLDALRGDARWNWWRWICALPSTPSAKSSARRPRKICSTPSSASFALGNDCGGSTPLLAHAINAAVLQILRRHRDAEFGDRPEKSETTARPHGNF